MADEMENIENPSVEDDGQISEDDWAAAMAEQGPVDNPEVSPADIFPCLLYTSRCV